MKIETLLCSAVGMEKCECGFKTGVALVSRDCAVKWTSCTEPTVAKFPDIPDTQSLMAR